jgi:tetratricopeptide (TPR) repeat protein
MALLRVEKLFQSLTHIERELLNDVLGETKHKTLKLLFDTLTDFDLAEKKIEDHKSIVFKTLFGRAYTAEEDYLFRNQCRLLTEKIEGLIAGEMHKKEFEENETLRDIALLKALLKRKLWTEFEALHKKSLEAALKACQYEAVVMIEKIYLEFVADYNPLSSGIREQGINDTYRICSSALKHHFITEHSRLQCANSIYKSHYEPHYNLKVDQHPFDEAFDFKHISNPLVQYYRDKAIAFAERDNIQIDAALRALESLLQVEGTSKFLLIEKVSMLSNVGVAYLLTQKYSQAKNYMEQAVELAKEHHLPDLASILFNYASVLMKLGDFRDALLILEENRTMLEIDMRTKFKSEGMRTFAYIFLKNSSEALKSIPPNISQRPDPEHHYFRFAYMIIPYLRGNTDDALRETNNFSKRFTRSKHVVYNVEDKVLVQLYSRLFKASMQPTGKTRFRVLDILKKEMEKFVKSHPVYDDFLPLAWIKQELETLRGD